MSEKNGVAPTTRQEKINLSKPGLWTIKITPDLAFHWLTKNWDNNRRMRPGHVEYLAGEMRAGNWRGDHPDALLFDTEGNLFQGQHRLSAVIECGLTVEMRVEGGVDPGLYPYLDAGLARNLEDRVKLVANDKDNKMVVMLVNFFRKRDKARKWSSRTSPEMAVAIFDEHKASFTWAASVHRTIRGVGRVPIMAAAAEYYEQDKDKAQAFIETLLSMNGEGPVSQARLLRDTILRRANMRGSVTGGLHEEAYQLAIAAMKAHKQGRTLKRLMIGEGW